MGNSIGCIVQRYGPQLATIISLEKAETFLQEKSEQVKKTLEESSVQVKSKFNNTFQQQKQRVNKIFESTKKDIGEEKLNKFAKSQNKDVDEVLQKNTIEEQFNQVQKTFNQELDVKMEGLTSQIETQKSEFSKKIQEQKPTVPIFSQLPNSQRGQVVTAIEDKFAPQMKQKQEQFTKPIEQLFNPQKYKQMLSNLDPSEQLKNIGDSAEGITKTLKLATKAASMGCFK